MAVTLFPTAAFAEEGAEEGPAAQVGGQTYDVLKKAIDAAEAGETITLLRDYTQKDVDAQPCDLTGKTLDLNGKTYTLGYPVWFFGDNGTVKNGTLATESSGREQYTMVIGGGASADQFTVDGVTLNNGLSIANGTNVRLKNLTASTLGAAAIPSAVRLGKGCSARIESGRYTVSGMQNSAVYNNGGTLTIDGGEFFASGSSAVAVLTGAMDQSKYLPSTTIINNGAFTTEDSAYVLWNWSALTINGGTFSSDGGFLNDYLSSADTTVNGGYFHMQQGIFSDDQLHICGGYYENEPSPSTSCSDAAPYGYTVVLSDVSGYPYQVVKKNNEVRACASSYSYPDVPEDHPMYLTTCQTDVMEAAAKAAAQNLDEKTIAALKQQAMASGGAEFDKPGSIYLYVVADLRFVPGSLEGNHLSMELTPVYSIWASKLSNAQDYNFNEDADGNPYDSSCCKVQAAQELQIDRPATVQIRTLPDDLVSNLLDADGVYIEHVKNGQTYIYSAALKPVSSDPPPQSLVDGPAVVLADPDIRVQTGTDQYYLTFTTYHGFSPFAVTTTAPAVTVTSEDGVTIGYESLQAAADTAQSGDKIVLHSGAKHTLRLSDAKSVKITNRTGADVTVTFNGTDKTLTSEASELFSYTRPSSSTGGGSNSYAVSAANAENGTVTVSPKRAGKGTTVTITVIPDKGYTLGAIAVKDANGDTVKLTDAGSGKYTFVMPGSAVTVSAEFAENQTETAFTDVSAGAYYAQAVKWAVDQGITNGVGGGLFAPDQPCTRAQIVTFLWRAAGSPAVKSVRSFADVSADSSYADAVAWAVENGVTNGVETGLFGPNQTCTRAQIVTFLYRAYLGK